MCKQTSSVIAILLGLTGAAAAQTPTAQAASAPTCAAPRIADQVDLKPVSGSDLMTVPVVINAAPRQFLLDVSRTADQVSQATMDELHLPQTTQSNGISAMTDNNTSSRFQATFFDVKSGVTATDYQARVRAADFTIGSATVHDVVFMVANDRDLGKAKPYDGLLTTGVFSHYDLNLDFGGNKLSFLAPTSCADPNQVAYWPHEVVAVIPMTMTNGKFSVPVTIDGQSIPAVIDTGSARTVMRRDIAESMFSLKADTPDMMPEGDLRDGFDLQVYHHTFAKISFGSVIAGNVPALIETNSMVHKISRTPTLGSRATFANDPSERIPSLTLGMDVLHQLHLYIATDQKSLYATAAK